MSSSSDDDESIPPPPPPPPPMPPSAAAEEELEIQMTPVLEKMDVERGMPLEQAARGSTSPPSPTSSRASSAYGGEQIELNLDEIGPDIGGSGHHGSVDAGVISNDGTSSNGKSRKSKCLILAAAILVIGGAVGVALGVTLGKKDGPDKGASESNAGENDAVSAAADDADRDLPSSTTASPAGPPVSEPSVISEQFIDATKPPTPSDAVSIAKEEAALKVLEANLPVESYDAVSDANKLTPQNDALNWVLYEDTWPHDWAALAEGDEDAEHHFMQRYTVVTLYAVLGGENWSRQANWKSGMDVCEWKGVECFGEAEETAAADAEATVNADEEAANVDGGTAGSGGRTLRKLGTWTETHTLSSRANTNSSGRKLATPRLDAIKRLRLSKNKLRGWLPPDISALTSIEALELHENDIIGEIPPHLYNMISLKTIFLDDNKLEGTLSEDVGKLVNLERLTLSENKLWGPLPEAMGELTNLSM